MVSITNADRVFSEQYMIHENDKYKTIPERSPALITEETVISALEPFEYLPNREVIGSLRNDDTRESLSMFSARLLIAMVQYNPLIMFVCPSVTLADSGLKKPRHTVLQAILTKNTLIPSCEHNIKSTRACRRFAATAFSGTGAILFALQILLALF